MEFKKLGRKLSAILCSVIMVGGSNISNHVAMAGGIKFPEGVKLSEIRGYCNGEFLEYYLDDWRSRFQNTSISSNSIEIGGTKCTGWLYKISGKSTKYGEYTVDLCLLDGDRFFVIVVNNGKRVELGPVPFSYLIHVLQCNSFYNGGFRRYECLDVLSKFNFLKALNKGFFIMDIRFACRNWSDIDCLDSILKDVNGDKDKLLHAFEKKFRESMPMYKGKPLFQPEPKPQIKDIEMEVDERGQPLEERLYSSSNDIVDPVNLANEKNDSNMPQTFTGKELEEIGLSEDIVKNLVKEDKLIPVKKGGKTVYIVAGSIGGGIVLGLGTFALIKLLGKKRKRSESQVKSKVARTKMADKELLGNRSRRDISLSRKKYVRRVGNCFWNPNIRKV